MRLTSMRLPCMTPLAHPHKLHSTCMPNPLTNLASSAHPPAGWRSPCQTSRRGICRSRTGTRRGLQGVCWQALSVGLPLCGIGWQKANAIPILTAGKGACLSAGLLQRVQPLPCSAPKTWAHRCTGSRTSPRSVSHKWARPNRPGGRTGDNQLVICMLSNVTTTATAGHIAA